MPNGPSLIEAGSVLRQLKIGCSQSGQLAGCAQQGGEMRVGIQPSREPRVSEDTRASLAGCNHVSQLLGGRGKTRNGAVFLLRNEKIGWGGRIRTFTIHINSVVSYRLDHAPAAFAADLRPSKLGRLRRNGRDGGFF
jgi:hypothetical protein